MSREKRVKEILFAKVVMAFALLIVISGTFLHATAQNSPMEKSYIRGGVLTTPKEDKKIVSNSLSTDEAIATDTIPQKSSRAANLLNSTANRSDTTRLEKAPREKYFTDSMSLSKVCWTAAVLPGFGQIYNKQAWKLPILYSTLGGGLALYINESKKYRPLKEQYDELTFSSLERTEELNDVQNAMIRSNTRRQLYLGTAFASYIYMLGDAAINYSTNDTSDIKRATTLATICPGAGQIYNKSYWKLPFVVGGFAAMIYVVDWNNRGYKRFSKAYQQLVAYEADKDAYPDGAPDEFAGQYSVSDMQNLRDSYRRNRDLSIIMMAGLYVLQIIDAHVDAHFKDFDVSDDLALDIQPAIGSSYSTKTQSNGATYGFNIGLKF